MMSDMKFLTLSGANFITALQKNAYMGPPRFERESEDPQSPRMPGYPTVPCVIYVEVSRY